MLKIRKEQIGFFRPAVLRNFENNMIQHLQEFSPKHSQALGEDGVRNVVRLGVKRAEKYGLTNRGPVRFYIELMFMLGSYFDTDCQFPWASRILADPEIADQTARADCLFDKAMDYVEKVAGPNRKYAKESLSRACRQSFKDLREIRGGQETDILSRLKMNFPQKCQYVGDQALRSLVKHGTELAQKFSVSSDAGVILFVCFMFMLGHGFAADPQYPWCEMTLNNENISDPNKRIERLYSKSITYITNVLASDGGRRDHVVVHY